MTQSPVKVFHDVTVPGTVPDPTNGLNCCINVKFSITLRNL